MTQICIQPRSLLCSCCRPNTVSAAYQLPLEAASLDLGALCGACPPGTGCHIASLAPDAAIAECLSTS